MEGVFEIFVTVEAEFSIDGESSVRAVACYVSIRRYSCGVKQHFLRRNFPNNNIRKLAS